MKGNLILVVAGLILVAFALGVVLGSRRSSAPPATSLPPGRPATALAAGAENPCVDFHNAASLVGKNGCVTGHVMRTFTSQNGNTFLDFCEDFRNCPFTSVIFVTDVSKFGSLDTLRGRNVELRGDVTLYKSHAEIVLHDPEQIHNIP